MNGQQEATFGSVHAAAIAAARSATGSHAEGGATVLVANRDGDQQQSGCYKGLPVGSVGDSSDNAFTETISGL